MPFVGGHVSDRKISAFLLTKLAGTIITLAHDSGVGLAVPALNTVDKPANSFPRTARDC